MNAFYSLKANFMNMDMFVHTYCMGGDEVGSGKNDFILISMMNQEGDHIYDFNDEPRK